MSYSPFSTAWRSPSNRWRRFGVLNLILQLDPVDSPSFSTEGFPDQQWRTQFVPAPCVVSTDPHNTRDPVVMVHERTGRSRFAHSGEMDRLQGLPTGYSDFFGILQYSEEDRISMTGACLNQFHVRMIMRYADLSIRGCRSEPRLVAPVVSASLDEADPVKLELYLSDMARTGSLDAWIAERLKNAPSGEMHIQLKDPTTPAFKTKYVPTVPAKFVKAARKKLDNMLNDGSQRFTRLAPSDITSRHWVSPMFMKDKGRVDSEGLQVLRTLCNCQVLNSHTALVKWWTQFKPVLDDFLASIPESSTHFCVRDLENAFEIIRIALESLHFMVFVIRIEDEVWYVQCNVAGQGLSLSAYYFPVWIFMKLHATFGYVFLLWFAMYVDDNVIHGPSESRCEGRNLIFESFCRVAGLPISSKTPALVQEEVVGAGVVISKHGLRADDCVETAVRMRIALKVKGVKQARNLRGVIQSARTAFYFDVMEQYRWAELTHPMDKAIALADSSGKFPSQFWSQEVEPSLQELLKFLDIVPRAHIHPDSLITETSCLVFLTDASDDAAGGRFTRLRYGMPETWLFQMTFRILC